MWFSMSLFIKTLLKREEFLILPFYITQIEWCKLAHFNIYFLNCIINHIETSMNWTKYLNHKFFKIIHNFNHVLIQFSHYGYKVPINCRCILSAKLFHYIIAVSPKRFKSCLKLNPCFVSFPNTKKNAKYF